MVCSRSTDTRYYYQYVRFCYLFKHFNDLHVVKIIMIVITFYVNVKGSEMLKQLINPCFFILNEQQLHTLLVIFKSLTKTFQIKEQITCHNLHLWKLICVCPSLISSIPPFQYTVIKQNIVLFTEL